MQYTCPIALLLISGLKILNIFLTFIKTLHLIMPSDPYRPIFRSFEKILNLRLSLKFQNNPSLFKLTLKTVFLSALASKVRISELGVLLKGRQYVLFSANIETIYHNPNFLKKN